MINERAYFTTKQLLILLLCVIPIGYQIVNSYGLDSNWIYVGFIIINILFFVSLKNKVFVSKKILFISVNFLIAYIIVPIVFNTVGNINPKNSFLYMGLFLIFINALTIITIFLEKKDYGKVLINTLIGNSLYLIFLITSHIEEISLGNMLSVVNGNRATRADFSFGHPNTAAIFIFVEIILIYLVFIHHLNKKMVGRTLIVIFLFPLLATGSRTALYSLLLFFVLEIYRKTKSKIKNTYKKFLIYPLLLLLGIVFLKKFDLANFLDSSSGRNENVMYNLKYIIDSNRLITGFGPTPITDIRFSLPNVAITDTWYITHVLSFGIISLGIIIGNIIYLLITFLKNMNDRNGYVVSLIIVLLFYSGAENVLFIPGTIISWVFWMIIYVELNFITKVE